MDMSEKKDALQFVEEAVKFILVGTTHPGNIGAAARAMKKYGYQTIGIGCT